MVGALLLLSASVVSQGPGYPQTMTVTVDGSQVVLHKMIDATVGRSLESWTDTNGITHFMPVASYTGYLPSGSFVHWQRDDSPSGVQDTLTLGFGASYSSAVYSPPLP